MKNRKNKDNTAGGYASAYPTRLSLLLHFLAGSASFFLAGVVSAALAGLFDLLNPKNIAWAVDRLDTQSAAEAAGLVILVTCLGALFRYLYSLFNAKGAEKLVEQMRNELYGHIEHLPFSWYMENATGDVIQRCTSDVETVKNFLSEQRTGFSRSGTDISSRAERTRNSWQRAGIITGSTPGSTRGRRPRKPCRIG